MSDISPSPLYKNLDKNMNNDILAEAIKAIQERISIETIEEQRKMELVHARKGIQGSGISKKELALIKIRKDAEAKEKIGTLKLQFPVQHPKPTVNHTGTYRWINENVFSIMTSEGKEELTFPRISSTKKFPQDYLLFRILLELLEKSHQIEGTTKSSDISRSSIIDELAKNYPTDIMEGKVRSLIYQLKKRINGYLKDKNAIRIDPYDESKKTYRFSIKIVE